MCIVCILYLKVSLKISTDSFCCSAFSTSIVATSKNASKLSSNASSVLVDADSHWTDLLTKRYHDVCASASV